MTRNNNKQNRKTSSKGMRFTNVRPSRHFGGNFGGPRNMTSRRGNKNRFSGRYSYNNSSAPIQNFKVYVGSVGKDGLKIPVGPDKLYSNTSYFMTARNFNNYKPIKAVLEYTPLVNQTTAIAMVNAYLTTDLNAGIPSNDVNMKNSTVTHRGFEWFSAYHKKVNLRIPILKDNTYDTGSGDLDGNSEYGESAYIIVKPTSMGDSKITAVGECYLNITVRFSSPAAPIPVSSTVSKFEVKPDIFVDYQDHTVLMHFACNSNKYCTFHFQNGSVNHFYNYSIKKELQEAAWSAMPNLKDAQMLFTNDDKPSKDKYPNLAIFNYVDKGTAEKPDYKWEQEASAVYDVRVINNVIPSSFTYVYDNDISKPHTLNAASIPTYNLETKNADFFRSTIHNNVVPSNTFSFKINPDDENEVVLNSSSIPIHNLETEDAQFYRSTIHNNIVPSDKYSYKLKPDDEDEITITTTSMPIHNKITEDTDDTNVNVTNKSMPVDILNQPILVKEEKSTSEEVGDILGIIEGVAGALI